MWLTGARAGPTCMVLRLSHSQLLRCYCERKSNMLEIGMEITAPTASIAGYLDRLNEAQRTAVLHGTGTSAEPLLIIAGAGTGKTSTLAHRVAYSILEGADPRRILMMTFSRRAAVEMTRRIERIAGEVLGEKAAPMIAGLTWAGTFHAIGARILRDNATALGLDPAFTLHDRRDSEDLLNIVRYRLGFSRAEHRFPVKGTCLAIYSRAVNAQQTLDQVLEQGFPWCVGWATELKTLFAAYVAAKQDARVLDYDDLLLYWAEMLADPAAAAELGAVFDQVFVDEYQDTNRLQATILLALKPDGRGVTVVGDDAQAIYGFRAAEVRNILDFPGLFAPRARTITLERNYRSTGPILAAANAVIGEAREQFAKTLWTKRRSDAKPLLTTVLDETAQAEHVCSEVLAGREAGIPLKAQAVLFRTGHPPQATSDLAGAPLRDEDYLVLSTIHSAKGQEWRSVFVLNCVDGCLPSDLATGTPAEIEEERRLFYVAMTRAKDALHLITPLRFYAHGQAARGDRHVYAAPTRFLPGHILERFEQRTWSSTCSAGSAARPLPPRDLKARMRGMWA